MIWTYIFIIRKNFRVGALWTPQGGVTTQIIEKKILGPVTYQMKALEKCYQNMTLTLVCDLRGHRSGLKWSQKVNITQGGHVHSFDITNVIFCVPLIYNTLVCEKRNFGRRPGGAECDSPNRFMKVVRYSHVAYQMEALKKCYKNMILILVWDLRGHYDYYDLKWPQNFWVIWHIKWMLLKNATRIWPWHWCVTFEITVVTSNDPKKWT